MSHEIESDYKEEYDIEERQCQKCDSFSEKDNKPFCPELEIEVSPIGHCDFFRSKD